MIKRLLILNGLAAVFAVINHAVVWELTAMFWWTDRYLPAGSAATQLQSLRFFTAGLVDQLVFFAVFAFLFISGFFIAIATGRTQKTIPWRLVFQRVKFLIIPYILWSVILILLSVALQVLNIAGGKVLYAVGDHQDTSDGRGLATLLLRHTNRTAIPHQPISCAFSP